MRRLRAARGEAGQVAAEYLGVLAVVTLIVAALALTPLGPSIASSLQALICQIMGDGCDAELANPYLPDACTVSTSQRSFGASVKVTFIKVGGSEGYIREEKADGTIHVTWISEGDIAATGGLGARGSIEIGGDGVRGGAMISGDIGIGASLGQTAVFTDPADARRYIEAHRREAIRRQAGLAGALDRAIRGGTPQQADIVAFDVQAGAKISVAGGFGPVGASGSAEGAVVLGGTHDRRTGETTLYLEVEGEVSGSAGVLLGTSGSRSGSRVVALTLDADNRPSKLTVTSTTATGRGGVLDGAGYTLDDLGRVLADATVRAGAESTHSVVVTSELDLTNAANRDAAAALLAASATTNLPGGADRLRDATVAFNERMMADGRIGVAEYEGNTWGLGAGLEVALGAKLGFDLGYDSSDATLIGANFLDRLPDGTRVMAPWVACTGG